MKLRWVVVSCALLLSMVVWVQAQEAAEAKQAAEAPLGRLVQPWNKISDLSEEQTLKIRQIRGRTLKEIAALRERETAEVMALLTDEQKAQVKAFQDQQRAAQKTVKRDTQ